MNSLFQIRIEIFLYCIINVHNSVLKRVSQIGDGGGGTNLQLESF